MLVLWPLLPTLCCFIFLVFKNLFKEPLFFPLQTNQKSERCVDSTVFSYSAELCFSGHFIRYTPKACILKGMCSTRCWKHSLVVLVHVDMIASHRCCRVVCCKSPIPPHPKGALLDWDLVTAEATGVHRTHCRVGGTNLRWCVLCACYLEGTIH